MKAAVRTKYGPPAILRIQEIEKPAPGDDELLIRVYATTVSRTDYHNLTGRPFIMHFFLGLFRPRLSVTGTDFAGQIEAIGKNVKFFKPGDRVMGFEFLGLQSHAYYLTLPENKDLVRMPDSIHFEEAAACIEGAFYSLSVINFIKPQAGQKALVIGGTGAIGSSYVQYLKFYDVCITAVCKGENAELVKSLGADRIIDFEKEDFRKDNERYDFVFDAVDKSSYHQCRRLLKNKGVFTSSGGFYNLFLAIITPIFGGRKVLFLPPKDPKGCLNFIAGLVQKGRFRPVIDRKYPLENISEAYEYVGSGQKIGNVIITMED